MPRSAFQVRQLYDIGLIGNGVGHAFIYLLKHFWTDTGPIQF